MTRRARIHALWVSLLGLVLVLRLPFFDDPLGIDEAGYAIVARDWHRGGTSIYGDLWVDRPPLLLMLYRGAMTLFPGREELAIDLLGLGLTLVLVGAIARAAWRLGGLGAAAWAGAVAGALASTPALRGQTVNAELPAATLVACSICAAIEAAVPGRSFASVRAWAALAGATGAGAMLVKQNFVEGLVLGVTWGVAMFVAGRADRHERRRAVALLSAGLGGVLIPLACLFGWMASPAGPGIGATLDALVGFRLDAIATIAAESRGAVDERRELLWFVAATTGVLPLVIIGLVGAVRARLTSRPLAIAWVVGTAYACMAVVAGGSWWRHYLIELTPLVALAAGLLAAYRGWVAFGARVTSVATVVVAAATVAAWTIDDTRGNRQQHAAELVGSTLASAREPDDTAVIFGGHANALLRSGMQTPYPYLWSLPMRVRDPQLTDLVATLRGDDSPEWFVTWFGVNPWQIDARGDLQRTLDERYRLVAKLCQQRVYLRRDVTRPLAVAPPRC